MIESQGLSALDAVSGEEALNVYTLFHRNFVQRKRQELVNPNFISIGEIILPRASLVHFTPRGPQDLGPSVSEAFISNYGGEVFIDFSTNFEPVLGNGRKLTFEVRKAIQSYRSTHYVYNWTKNIETVYGKEQVLIVKNYALVNQMWLQRPTLFVNFEVYYNRFNMLMEGVNEESVKGVRKQYLRIDLPLNMPGWQELLVDYDHYVKSFKDGLPVPSTRTINKTKAEGSYWLIDYLAFLFGDYEYSLFSKLSEDSQRDLHLVFVSNSRCLIVNVATLKGWLDALLDKRHLDKIEKEKERLVKEAEKTGKPVKVEHASQRAGHAARLNVAKRVYLGLLTLARSSITEAMVIEENKDANQGSTKDASVVKGEKGVKEGKGGASGKGRDSKILGKNEPVEDLSNPNSIFDVFTDSKGSGDGSVHNEGTEGTEDNSESADEWTSAVDDDLLEQEKVVGQISVKKDPFVTPESGVALALEGRAREGTLTVAEQQFFMRKGTQYKHIELENGQSLEEFIRVTDEEVKSLSSDGVIDAYIPTLTDPSMLRSRAKVLKQGYVDKFLLKDTIRMFIGLQNAGIALNDFKHEIVKGVEGTYDVFTVQYHDVEGDQSTHHIRLPRPGKDSAFIVDGVKSHMQLQRMESPIRKINKHKVALTSYYDRRIMVQRSQKVVDDQGAWLTKQVVLKAKDNPDLTLSRGSVLNTKYNAPRTYTILGSKFQWIKVGDYTLDFNVDKLLETYPAFKKHTKPNSFLIGVKDSKPLTIDSFGNLYLDDQGIGTIEALMGINTAKSPTEYATVNISGYNFPIGVVLCYYFGIDELLKIVKATVRSVPMGTRPKLDADEYAIAFNDEYLIFNRREKLASLIFGGMPKLNNIGNFSRGDLNETGIWGSLIGDPKVRPAMFQEMTNLYNLFIDPITKEELIRRGYSESFHYLLIDAVKLLETDFTRHEVELEEQRIVGYERFPGHVYRELCKSNRQLRNKGKGRKHKLEINPEAVILNIITDTSVNLVEEVNPIHQIKDQEEVTFGGTGGRSEITVVKRARLQLDSYTGVISEANKDSGKVGFVTYTTSDPRIADYRGNIAIGEKNTLTGISSVTGNLAYGVSKDDTKRTSFTSTQASQAVSAENYTANITRTGYEYLIAHRTSELYSKVAANDGKVTKITEDGMEVTYSDGTIDKYPLGLTIGEASGEYHRHTRITDLVVGDTFKKGEVIGWDKQWFERDIFVPGQVAWKAGRMSRIALIEDQDTYEDSIAITKEMADESITPYMKPKRFAMDVIQNIFLKVKVGDSVDYDSILCDVEDSHLVGDESSENTLMEDINRLGIKQVKSPHHGKIVKIECTYNSPKELMTESVRKLVNQLDKERRKLAEFDSEAVESGVINNTLNVNKPVLSPGKVMFTIYIESMDGSTTADKYVIGNQMKGTVGVVLAKPITTRDGRKVDVKQSYKGTLNRMVLSLRDKLATNEAAYQFTQNALRIYRGD